MKLQKKNLSRYGWSDFSEREYAASLLVEAIFTLPLVFFFLISWIGCFPFFSVHAEMQEKMENRSAQWALFAEKEDSAFSWLALAEGETIGMRQRWKKKAGVKDVQLIQAKKEEESGMMDTAWLVREHLIGLPGKLGTITVVQRCLHRTWSGRSLKAEEDADSETDWVYITEHGSVYHRYRGCTYLNVDLQYCEKKEIENMRNPDGSKYYACEICKPSEQEYGVYVATYGTRYHCTAACSSIRRLVRKVPFDQVEGRKPCSKCADLEAG